MARKESITSPWQLLDDHGIGGGNHFLNQSTRSQGCHCPHWPSTFHQVTIWAHRLPENAPATWRCGAQPPAHHGDGWDQTWSHWHGKNTLEQRQLLKLPYFAKMNKHTPYLDSIWLFQLSEHTLALWPDMLRRRFWLSTSHSCEKSLVQKWNAHVILIDTEVV